MSAPAIFRTTISLDPVVAKAADMAAKAERRSFSQLCELALMEYAPVSGRLGHNPAKYQELNAAAELVGVEKALGAIRRLKRSRKVAA